MSHSFASGGICLSDPKPTRDRPIQNALLPKRACVPLLQHLGEPAVAAVKVGERVQEGSLIGRANGAVSAAVHAPMPGIVSAFEEVRLASGALSPAVVIEFGGEFLRHSRSFTPRNPELLSVTELQAIVAESGIVGLGGTLFPTHLKLRLPLGTRPDTLVVNGVECEPFLAGDYRLLCETPRSIIEGALLAARMLGTARTIIAVDERDSGDFPPLEAEASAANIELVKLAHRYPLGEERLLLEAVLGRRVAAGAPVLSAGAVVLNVATINALYEAVALRKPLYERVVTVAGGAIRDPANLKCRVGTPIGSLIEECGGFATPPAKIIAGGPFTGYEVLDLSIPVTKGTSAILALADGEARSAPRTACFACGKCVDACPERLDPSYLFKRVEHAHHDEAIAAGLLACIECGCCSYVCPAHIPLAYGLRLGKRAARAEAAE